MRFEQSLQYFGQNIHELGIQKQIHFGLDLAKKRINHFYHSILSTTYLPLLIYIFFCLSSFISCYILYSIIIHIRHTHTHTQLLSHTQTVLIWKVHAWQI